MIKISYNPAKQEAILAMRIADFDTAAEVFEGLTREWVDERHDYGETRLITVGLFRGRMMVIVRTERNGVRHIMLMRKANEREQAKYGGLLGKA